jgi:hypothetical protein
MTMDTGDERLPWPTNAYDATHPPPQPDSNQPGARGEGTGVPNLLGGGGKVLKSYAGKRFPFFEKVCDHFSSP